MPIYEYHCDRCDDDFEEFRSIRDEHLPECPSCESTSVRRLISATSFQLKGTGWYATDYKRASRHQNAGDKDCSASQQGASGEVSPVT